MKTLTVTEASKHFSSLVHEVGAHGGEPVQITVRGKAAAVLLSSEEYERMRRHMLDLEIDHIFKEFHDANVALAAK